MESDRRASREALAGTFWIKEQGGRHLKHEAGADEEAQKNGMAACDPIEELEQPIEQPKMFPPQLFIHF